MKLFTWPPPPMAGCVLLPLHTVGADCMLKNENTAFQVSYWKPTHSSIHENNESPNNGAGSHLLLQWPQPSESNWRLQQETPHPVSFLPLFPTAHPPGAPNALMLSVHSQPHFFSTLWRVPGEKREKHLLIGGGKQPSWAWRVVLPPGRPEE